MGRQRNKKSIGIRLKMDADAFSETSASIFTALLGNIQ